MELRIIRGSITEIESDALIVNLFEGVTIPGGATGAVDGALHGLISESIARKEISGKLMETAFLHTNGKIGPKRVLVIGLGKSEDFDLRAVRNVSGAAIRFLREKGARSVTTIVHGAGIGALGMKEAARAVVEGTIIGLYRSDLYKKQEEPRNEIETFTIVEQNENKMVDLSAGAREGRILAEATNDARTLSNEPSNRMTPTILAERALKVAEEFGLGIEVLDEKKIAELKMGGLLSVAQGSIEPPRFIILRYHAGKDKKTLALVGKGITFDSGGISLKPGEGMQHMKYDKSGAAAVIHAMRAISELKPDINVIGLVPATENMPGGSAYKPADVITCMSGKTVEVLNTDAEGRMILCDGLTYAVQEGADYIIDIATLTGACVVALGNDYTGIMGNNRELIDRLKESADISGERMWELPLPKEYKELLKSNFADLANIGNRWGGAIQGGIFLQEFVEDVPWIHMDIAGTADTCFSGGPASSDKYMSPGATGVGVRTMTTLAMMLAKGK